MTLGALHLGQDLAALGTAMLWSFSALSWSISGRRVGAVPVTAIRIVLAAAILASGHWAAFGRPWPVGVAGESLALLAGSGILGACIADLCLFRGLVLIGPRLGMLIQSLAPILTTVIAFWVARERPSGQAIAGIVCTVCGVVWVLAEQKGRQAWKTVPGGFVRGVAFCAAAAVIVSAGYVLSRMGVTGGRLTRGGPLPAVHPYTGALVRVATAAAATWLVLPLLGSARATLSAFADRRAMLIVAVGTVLGPVLGIWLSMVALKGSTAGVAVALINTSSLMLIPITYVAYGERPSPRTVSGTLLAVAGIFLLMLR